MKFNVWTKVTRAKYKEVMTFKDTVYASDKEHAKQKQYNFWGIGLDDSTVKTIIDSKLNE